MPILRAGCATTTSLGRMVGSCAISDVNPFVNHVRGARTMGPPHPAIKSGQLLETRFFAQRALRRAPRDDVEERLAFHSHGHFYQNASGGAPQITPRLPRQ